MSPHATKICPTCAELFHADAAFCPYDRAPLVVSTDPLLGRTLGSRYRLIKKLGAGGMSVVYLARHVMIDRLNAVKILRQDLSLDPSHRERFLREARAVNRINHPNIVEITDFGDVDGIAYLVMEYAQGSTLLEVMRAGPLAWDRAASIAAQIAAALGRVHLARIVHRDLKPENVIVLLGTQDRIKLTDFGIAKLLDAPALTFSQQMFGTPGYIAPEIVEGSPAEARSDLFALGVLLTEMISGRLPWEARGAAELLLKPLSTAPTPLHERVPGVPAELEALVLSLLSRRPQDRPADAFEVERTLLDVLRRKPSLVEAAAPEAASGREADDTIMTGTTEGSQDETSDALPERPRTTANLGRLQTSEMALRWSAAIAEIERAIARARRHKRPANTIERAEGLLAHARQIAATVDRATSTSGEAQARADTVDAHGREFRQALGHAIDELSRERASERAHFLALREREGELEQETGGAGGQADARMWELGAVRAEVDRARAVVDDLSFQIVELELRLESKNETHERERESANAKLEGAIAAVRALTAELARTMDEATALVTAKRRAAQ